MHDLLNKYRIFPRVFLVLFTIATGVSINWYLSFPVTYQIECNDKLMLGLLDRGIGIDAAEAASCRTVDVIGRPSGYTFLINSLIGSCSVVFAFYVNSGSTTKPKEPKGASD